MNRFLSLIVGVLWAITYINIVIPAHNFPVASSLLLFLFLVLGFRWLPSHAQILCVVLILAAVGLAGFYDTWIVLFHGIDKASIFPAFLSTIVLLRAVAEQRPEVDTARKMFNKLPKRERDSGIIAGTHLIGTVLQVGVFAILAPILGRSVSQKDRQDVFTVAIRGMATVPFWSPFMVGMAVASEHLPLVPLWQILLLGLPLTFVGFLISAIFFDRNSNISRLLHSLASLTPVALPVFIAAFIVVITTVTTKFSTLQALILSLPILCLISLAFTKVEGRLLPITQTFERIGKIGPEASILICATILGVVFESVLPKSGLLHWLKNLNLPGYAVIFIIILTMNIAGLIGIHAIVTGTFLLVVFTSVTTGVTDLVLMQAILVGWGLCSVISIGSLTVATGATMFGIPPTELITKSNIAFVFLTTIIIGIILIILNNWLV